MEGVIGRFAGSSRAILGNELGISEQKNLEGILVEIQAAFNKAEKMQTTLVQHRWVSDVKDTAYDLEILFEEIQLKEVASTLRLLSSVQLNIDGKLHLFSRFPPGRPSSRDMISMVIERLENLRQGIKSLNIASCLGQGKDSSSFPQSIRNRIITARNNHSTSRPIPIENQSRIGGNSRGFKEIASLTEALTLSEPTYSALPWYLKQCLNFCILYPTGFCFDKDLLVLLWIAEGFVQPVFGKRLEDVGADYFDALLSWSFFQVSYPGSKCQDPTYKLCEGYDQTIRCFMSSDNEFVQIKFSDQVVSEKTRHASGIYHTTLHAFSSMIGLRSLLLLSNNPDRVKNVPFYFFLKLKYLRVLVLSGACIKEVPRPVWDLVHLRYLDLSYNKVKILPEELANLYRLQTIRLIDCPISMFPQNFHELVNLRHIHIDLMACLTVLPPHIGRLTSLQTLPFFIVKRESGCRIDELKELNDLRGELFIKNLENVVSLEEAEEAKLYAKQHLRSLKLKWGLRNLNVNYDVINGLQPHKNLSVLHIVYYRGSEFPYWISDPSFTNLVSITLTECKSWKLPPLGRLPCLESLVISDMVSVKDIGHEFYGHGTVKEGFPSLLLLKVSFMYDLEEWNGFNEGDFPMLRELSISSCPKLKKLPEMKCLGLLQELSICDCPELQWLPKKGFPDFIQSLEIMECPKVEERCQRETGADWNKIAHISVLETDFL